MACLYGGGITCLSNHGTTEPRNTRNTRNTRPYGHGIHGRRHYCGALGARNIVCVFCVFSGPLSATHSGWGAPRHHGIPGMACPYGCGITCLSNHGTTEPRNHGIHGIHGIPARMGTEYPEGGIIVVHWEARNIVCVFCVFSGPLSATYSGWGAPRHHGIPGMACPYGCGITCLSNHGTTEPRNHGTTEYTEYTEYPPVWARNTRKAALLWRIGRQETSSVYSVCSVVLLSATHSGWGAPRHHGIPGMAYPYGHGIHGRRHYCGALGGKKHRLCILCVQWSSYPQHTQAGGHHGTTEYPEWPTRMRAG